MELENNYELLQKKSISILNSYPRYLTILKTIAERLDNLQSCVNYLLKQNNIDTAEGVWLDYIAALVGTSRETFNQLDFFCLNTDHLNVEKLFYFEGLSDFTKGSLPDVLLRQRIKAQVGYNSSKCTREENLKIIKGLTNADKVIITKEKPMVLNVTLIGDEIIYPSIGTLKQNIVLVLGCGVGINNLTILSNEEANS